MITERLRLKDTCRHHLVHPPVLAEPPVAKDHDQMAMFLMLVLCNLSFMRCVSEPRDWVDPCVPQEANSWVMWQDLCHHSHRNKKDKLFLNKLFPIKIWVWGVLCNCGSNMWALVAAVMLTRFKI